MSQRSYYREIAATIRPACTGAVAIAVLAIILAVRSWEASFVLVAAIVLIAALMLLQLYRSIHQVHRQAESLRRASAQAERHHINVLRRIARFVEARDRYTRGHSERVGELSCRIAEKMGLNDSFCTKLKLAGQLHDIGLFAISDSLLASRAKMGADGYRSVQKHPEIAYQILRPLKLLGDVLDAVRHHHERMNGTGYPNGLAGEQIPLEARVLAVADAYDAMTHDRAHRAAMSPYAAMQELRRCTPAGYDSRCVEALAELMNLSQLQELMQPAQA